MIRLASGNRPRLPAFDLGDKRALYHGGILIAGMSVPWSGNVATPL
jgi:hypothetical protein